MKEVGIIGFGQMGQFIASFFEKDFLVFASDTIDKSKEAKEKNISFIQIKDAAAKDIVILAVPIQKIEETMKKIKTHLKKGALLLDVCSVKEKPLQHIKKHAPSYIEILGTHPLFGPQSGKDGLKGLSIILCPIRTTRTECAALWLESFGLNVIICTPKQHDYIMAETQALTHYICRALLKMQIQKHMFATKSFQLLCQACELIKNDSTELFRAMQRENPFAQEMRKKLRTALDNEEKVLHKS